MRSPGSMGKNLLLSLLILLALSHISDGRSQKSKKHHRNHEHPHFHTDSELKAADQTFQKRLLRGVLEKEISTPSHRKNRYLRSSLKSTRADLSPTLSVRPGLVDRNTIPIVQKHSKSEDICLLLDPRLRNLSVVPCLISMTNSSYRFYTN